MKNINILLKSTKTRQRQVLSDTLPLSGARVAKVQCVRNVLLCAVPRNAVKKRMCVCMFVCAFVNFHWCFTLYVRLLVRLPVPVCESVSVC